MVGGEYNCIITSELANPSASKALFTGELYMRSNLSEGAELLRRKKRKDLGVNIRLPRLVYALA